MKHLLVYTILKWVFIVVSVFLIFHNLYYGFKLLRLSVSIMKISAFSSRIGLIIHTVLGVLAMKVSWKIVVWCSEHQILDDKDDDDEI